MRFREGITGVNNIVVKVGSRIVAGTGRVERIASIAESIAALKKRGIKTVLVSSGAIAYGLLKMGYTRKPESIPALQAYASIGQIELYNEIERLFAEEGLSIGQVLLTWDDFRDKRRYLNLRNTLFTLMDMGVIPVINENDSVGVEEIKFGENDTLGAQVSTLTGTDLYVSLSDINGLFKENPKNNPDAEHIETVEEFSDEIWGYIDSDKTDFGSGGMYTKIKAAQIVFRAGIPSLIGNGYSKRLEDVLTDTAIGTLFQPGCGKVSSKKRRIAFTERAAGTLVVDQGASKAVTEKGSSLLPAGITEVRGEFARGDTVAVADPEGREIARGFVNYSSSEIKKVMGSNSARIRDIIGESPYVSVIHRNNMAVV